RAEKEKKEEIVKEKTSDKTSASGAGTSEIRTVSEKNPESEGRDSEKGKAVESEKQPAAEETIKKAPKKQRTKRKAKKRVPRKLIVSEDEGTASDDEPLVKKMKKSKSAPTATEGMDVDAEANAVNSESLNNVDTILEAQTISSEPNDTTPVNVIQPPSISDLPRIPTPNSNQTTPEIHRGLDICLEGIAMATEITNNKVNEANALKSLLPDIDLTSSQRSSPLQILEQHLEGELPSNPEPETQSFSETIQPTSEPENANTETEIIQEVETTHTLVSQPSSPKILTQFHSCANQRF
ncbi:hypothetical protein A2U01_0020038, partial [Trifolium medium]|nr:hypothetical protein [Trifolium medium]